MEYINAELRTRLFSPLFQRHRVTRKGLSGGILIRQFVSPSPQPALTLEMEKGQPRWYLLHWRDSLVGSLATQQFPKWRGQFYVCPALGISELRVHTLYWNLQLKCELWTSWDLDRVQQLKEEKNEYIAWHLESWATFLGHMLFNGFQLQLVCSGGGGFSDLCYEHFCKLFFFTP